MRKCMIFAAFMLLLCMNARSQVTPVLPVKGTWINLVYQDVRNKYTNPAGTDNTDPAMWRQKVKELSEMGIEYLVFMAVANEGKAFYPSQLMPHAYAEGNESPVDAIMNKAADLGMKVFLSTGWAKDQDDNLRDPAIKQRQKDIMKELAALYKDNKAFYGWYLPVEDCLCPILSEHAVLAVNDLSACATSLAPGKKIMISPYGIVDSAFDDPAYAQQLAKLKVDIIAYQDEVGCVREPFPLPRLRRNWERLRAIHDKLDIALWANCETFTWEEATNDRTSALIPAAYPRYLAQQAAASAAGVENIISFIVCGLMDKPASPYPLGQPVCSNKAYTDYMAWKRGDKYWSLLASSFMGELHGGIAARADDMVLAKLLDKEQAEENDMAYKDMKQQLDQLNERLQETLSNKSQNLKQLNEELIKTRATLDKRAEELDNQENELKMLKIEFAQKEEMLAQLQARLEEKEKEVEEIHRKISDALLGFADKGLSIERKNGKVYVSMEEKLLFASGSWTVSKEGEDALREIATVLANNPEIDVMVEGHTDNVPMNGKNQVKDNWDLSVMRASAITKILLKNGKISPKRIIPSGRGEYCPIVDNSTKESRAKNRRTEIILTPKFEELIDIIK